jgi:hypothetical protein
MHVVAAGGESVEGAGQTRAAGGSTGAAWRLRCGLHMLLLLR